MVEMSVAVCSFHKVIHMMIHYRGNAGISDKAAYNFVLTKRGEAHTVL